MVGCGGVRTLNEFEARFLGWASSGGTKSYIIVVPPSGTFRVFYLYMYSSTAG